MRRNLFAIVAIALLASMACADVLIIDVTKESQIADKIKWFKVDVTNTPPDSSVFLFTITMTKEASPNFSEGATLHHCDTNGSYLLSIPVATRKQKNETVQLAFSVAAPAVSRTILELTSYEEISGDGPVMIDTYNVQLSTYLDEDRTQWLQLHNQAIGVASKGKSRSYRHAGAWFNPDMSLVYKNKKLKALRYHFAFYTSWGDKTEQLIKTKTATDIVEYDLISKQWKRLPNN